MKNAFSFKALAITVSLLSLGFLSSCYNAPQETSKQNIVESNSMIGLWQKQKEVPVEVDGVQMTIMENTNLYKCVLGDGTFFLFRAYTDSLGHEQSQVELYGTYLLTADTLCTEVITTHCLRPALSGITSDLHYELPSRDLLNVWYNLKDDDGTSGSNEWIPEVWKRVNSAL